MTSSTRLPKRLMRHAPLIALSAAPLALIALVVFGPFITDPLLLNSGFGIGIALQLLKGATTIDPNIATTSFALGLRAARDVISGTLPLWNHFQGFGAPLLGEMQSAALFPPTLLLLLPNGQMLEHILLQWIAGVGAFFFFRRFGLGLTASVAGAVLYELNGVFALLRNAAFNPVAFLPWLLFGVEALRTAIIATKPYRTRLTYICATAGAGALALYAGFPETAYLYGVLVVVWGVFRTVGLGRSEAVKLVADLAAAALLALIISAPLIVAFVSFLAEGHVGGHGKELAGVWQEKETALLYLLPYLYGTFLAAPDARLGGLSISTGGYIALLPVALAAAALVTPGRRAVKVFLCAWVIVALGASHGWPVIYDVFMALPLMSLAVPGRYLNASWIICVIFLAALMIDQMPRLDAAERRRAMLGALGGVCAIFAAAAIAAGDILPRAWDTVRVPFLLSVALGSGAVVCALVALQSSSQKIRTTAVALGLGEAAALFVTPFFAYPRMGGLDREAIAFLHANIGYQRVAKTDGVGMNPNFGAALGIPLLNFDDLPSPRRTIDYIQTHIDAYATNIFVPEHPALPDEELKTRRALLKRKLPDYAAAGVKYVMAAPDFFGVPGIAVDLRDEAPIILEPGQRLSLTTRHTTATVRIDAITVRVATFRNTSTGTLKMRFCVGDVCARGIGDMTHVSDGLLLMIPLDTPLVIGSGEAFTVTFEKAGPTNAAIWTYPLAADAAQVRFLESPTTSRDTTGIDLGFIPAESPRPAHNSRAMALYELQDVRLYATAPGCEIKMLSHDEMQTSCAQASRLTRLNVHMAGWRATVNGAETPIGLAQETFQTVDLPQGAAFVSFRYAPPGFHIALAAAAAGLALISGVFIGAIRRRRQNSADGPVALP